MRRRGSEHQELQAGEKGEMATCMFYKKAQVARRAGDVGGEGRRKGGERTENF